MSATMCTQNSLTNPAAPVSAALRGAVLLLFGAFLGYGMGAGGDASVRDVTVPATASATDDWHGNVMRSTWPN